MIDSTDTKNEINVHCNTAYLGESLAKGIESEISSAQKHRSVLSNLKKILPQSKSATIEFSPECQ